MKKLIAIIAALTLFTVGAALADYTVNADSHDDLVWTKVNDSQWSSNVGYEKTDTGLMLWFADVDNGQTTGDLNISGSWTLNASAGDTISLNYGMDGFFNLYNFPNEYRSYSPGVTTIYYDDNKSITMSNSILTVNNDMDISYSFTLEDNINTVTGIKIYNSTVSEYDFDPGEWFESSDYHYPGEWDLAYAVTDPYFILPGDAPAPTPDPTPTPGEYVTTTVNHTGNITWTKSDPNQWSGNATYEQTDTGATVWYEDPVNYFQTAGDFDITSEWNINASAGDEVSLNYDLNGIFNESGSREFGDFRMWYSGGTTTIYYGDGQSIELSNNLCTIDENYGVTLAFTPENDIDTVTGIKLFNNVDTFWMDGPTWANSDEYHYPGEWDLAYEITNPYFVTTTFVPTPAPEPEPEPQPITLVPVTHTGDITWTKSDPGQWSGNATYEQTDTGATVWYEDPVNYFQTAGDFDITSEWNINASAGDEVSLNYDLNGIFNESGSREFGDFRMWYSGGTTTIYYGDGQSIELSNNLCTIDENYGVTLAFTPENDIDTVTGIKLFNNVDTFWMDGPTWANSDEYHYPGEWDLAYEITNPYFMVPGVAPDPEPEPEYVTREVTADGNITWTKVDPSMWSGNTGYTETEDGVTVYFKDVDYGMTVDDLLASGEWVLNAEAGDEIALKYDFDGYFMLTDEPQMLSFDDDYSNSYFNKTIIFFDDGKSLELTRDCCTMNEDLTVTYSFVPEEAIGTVTGIQVYNLINSYYFDGQAWYNAEDFHYPGVDDLAYTISNPYFTVTTLAPEPEEGIWSETDPDEWTALNDTEWTEDVDHYAIVYFTDPMNDNAVGAGLTCNSEWLVNGNIGDTIFVTYDNDGVDNLEGIVASLQDFAAVLHYDDGLTLTLTDALFDGNTVIFSGVLADAVGVVNAVDVFAAFAQADTTGTYTEGEDPNFRKAAAYKAFRLSVPEIRVTSESEVPEPATVAYALMGLGSLAGIKRRSKK